MNQPTKETRHDKDCASYDRDAFNGRLPCSCGAEPQKPAANETGTAQPMTEGGTATPHNHPDSAMMEDVADIIGRNGWIGLAATVRAASESLTALRSQSRADRESVEKLKADAAHYAKLMAIYLDEVSALRSTIERLEKEKQTEAESYRELLVDSANVAENNIRLTTEADRLQKELTASDLDRNRLTDINAKLSLAVDLLRRQKEKELTAANARIGQQDERISWLEQQREEECKQKNAALDESAICLKETTSLRQQAEKDKETIRLQQIQMASWKHDNAALLAQRDEVYWIWQGDDTDKLESLGCHILIRADQLRSLLLQREKEAEGMRRALAGKSAEWTKRSIACNQRAAEAMRDGNDDLRLASEVRSATYLLCADELHQAIN